MSSNGPPLANATDISVGSGSRTACAVADGYVYCWGSGLSGTLGNGSSTLSRNFPAQVEVTPGVPLSGMSKVSLGLSHACAVGTDNSLWCWGRNDFGQLGIGTTDPVYVYYRAVQVTALGNNVVQVSVSKGNTSVSSATTKDGTAWAWGDNTHEQLSRYTPSLSSTPLQILVSVVDPPMTGVAKVLTGYSASYILKNDGTVWTWGENAPSPKQYKDSLGNVVTGVWMLGGEGSLCYILKDGTPWNGFFGPAQVPPPNCP